MKGSKLISKLLVVAGIVMLLTGGLSVFAATGTGTQTVGFSNELVATVSFTQQTITAGAITANIPTALDGGTVTGNSNGQWSLSFAGSDFSDGHGNTLALAQSLGYRVGGTGTYPKITAGTPYTLATDHARGSEGYAMGFELTVPDTLAGSADPYSASLVYTIINT